MIKLIRKQTCDDYNFISDSLISKMLRDTEEEKIYETYPNDFKHFKNNIQHVLHFFETEK